MFPRRVLAWMMLEEEEAARDEERWQNTLRLRALLTPDHLTDSSFTRRYRLPKEGFEYVCSLLKDHVKDSQRVSMKTKILCALLFYANGDYQRVIGIANAFSQEGISKFITEVTEALNHPNVINQVIKFPNTESARSTISNSFYRKYGIPGVIGCIDGSHFHIVKPCKAVEHLYYCRKHFHSLNVQMVCDDSCRILAVNAKFGGATHDAFIWDNSIVNGYIQSLHRQGESVWLLGDSGYPQRPWLMTPYANADPGTAAASYNDAHMRARVNVENTFGRLKNRWRCVNKDRVLHYTPEKCAKIIQACCVLHNISIDFNAPDPEIQNTEPTFQYESNDIPHQENLTLLSLGRATRDRVANIVYAQNT